MLRKVTHLQRVNSTDIPAKINIYTYKLCKTNFFFLKQTEP